MEKDRRRGSVPPAAVPVPYVGERKVVEMIAGMGEGVKGEGLQICKFT